MSTDTTATNWRTDLSNTAWELAMAVSKFCVLLVVSAVYFPDITEALPGPLATVFALMLLLIVTDQVVEHCKRAGLIDGTHHSPAGRTGADA